MSSDYREIGEQIFNLVDNDEDKVREFMSDRSSEDAVSTWISTNVKENELSDLMKPDQTKEGLIAWIASQEGNDYFSSRDEFSKTIEANPKANVDVPGQTSPISREKLATDIEDEDDEIYSNDKKEQQEERDEIDIAMQALEDDSDGVVSIEKTGDPDDYSIAFEILDGSDDNDEDETPEEPYDHKKRIYLDHHVNKIVEKFDNDEIIDREVHKKYYVLKKKELKTSDKLDELEDILDEHSISMYDFPNISLKIYHSNEVELNRIFSDIGLDVRCRDIAHYTDNWHS